MAAAAFMSALFRIWLNEHMTVEKLLKDIAKLEVDFKAIKEANRACFKLSIDSVMVGTQTETSSDKERYIYTCSVALSNSGSPSSADRWRCRVKVGNVWVRGEVATYTGQLKLPIDQRFLIVEPTDFIHAKAHRPVQTGERLRGLFIFTVEKIKIPSERDARHCLIEISVADIDDSRFAVDQEIGVQENLTFKYFPDQKGAPNIV